MGSTETQTTKGGACGIKPSSLYSTASGQHGGMGWHEFLVGGRSKKSNGLRKDLAQSFWFNGGGRFIVRAAGSKLGEALPLRFSLDGEMYDMAPKKSLLEDPRKSNSPTQKTRQELIKKPTFNPTGLRGQLNP